MEKLKDVSGIEKEEVSISCAVKDPKATPTWYKSGQQLKSIVGGKFESQSKNGQHTLTIRNLLREDEDKFEVEIGGMKCSCKVTVLEGKLEQQ